MGSSISDKVQANVVLPAPVPIQPCESVPNPVVQHQTCKQVSIVENIDTSNIETIDDYIKIAPEKIKSEPRKSIDSSAALLQRARRQLPPLKKIRSLKKMDGDQNIEKENTSKKVIEEYLQKESYLFAKNKGSHIQISQLKQTENQDLNKVKQTRTKRMRVSKNLTMLHKTLYQ